MPDILRLPKNLFWYLGRLITSACWITRETTSNYPYPIEILLGVVAMVATLILYRSQTFPVADWAVWTVLAILPFLNNAIVRLAFGPSRQLYFASAGASVLTAWALRTSVHQFKSRLGSTTMRLVFICLFTGFVAASIFSLKRAEALSIYYAARGYAFRADNPDYHARAVELFERALNHAPDVVPLDLYTRLCQAGLASGKTYIPYLQAALDRVPDHALLNMLLGVSLSVEDDLERHKQGEKYIQKALENAPNKDQLRQDIAVAFQNLAVYFNKQNDLVRATDLYLKALQFYPQYPLVLYSLGHIFRDQKQYDQAIEAFQKVLQINPQHKDALRLLADVLYRRGHSEEAIQTYKKLEALQ
ncbi:MAG: tetratricopeptide repeat protein [bacterium]|nr:tetratricopeptide repeat protein [bacterium]